MQYKANFNEKETKSMRTVVKVCPVYHKRYGFDLTLVESKKCVCGDDDSYDDDCEDDWDDEIFE